MGLATKKTVSLSLEANVVHEYEEDETVPPEDIWYTGDDYADMKARSRNDAREWRRQGFGILLQETFAYPRPDAQRYINAFVLLEEEQSRRGLERSLCRQHGEERSEMKDRARQSVLIHQRRLQRDGVKPEEMAAQLGPMYKEISRCATVFARRLAMADELVTKQGESSKEAQSILDEHQQRLAARRRGSMERRMSNYSMVSTNSFDSKRRFGGRRLSSKNCPSSPASPNEEFYAAIA